MEGKQAARRYLVAAIIWTVAAGGMAAGIIAFLPGVAPMPALLFGLCAVCAMCWWGAFIREQRKGKKSTPKKSTRPSNTKNQEEE